VSIEPLDNIDSKLAEFNAWFKPKEIISCRLVQFCGNDLVGAIDVSLDEIELQISGLISEGFYVHWKVKAKVLYFKVFEYGGPEPTWENAFSETALIDINEILKKAGFGT